MHYLLLNEIQYYSNDDRVESRNELYRIAGRNRVTVYFQQGIKVSKDTKKHHLLLMGLEWVTERQCGVIGTGITRFTMDRWILSIPMLNLTWGILAWTIHVSI